MHSNILSYLKKKNKDLQCGYHKRPQRINGQSNKNTQYCYVAVHSQNCNSRYKDMFIVMQYSQAESSALSQDMKQNACILSSSPPLFLSL